MRYSLFFLAVLPLFSQANEIYLGGSAGVVHSKGSLSSLQSALQTAGYTVTGSVDRNEAAWKIFAGMQINEYFGAELAYLDMGKLDVDLSVTGLPLTTGTLQTITANQPTLTRGVSASLVYSRQYNDVISWNARAGLYRWKSESKASLPAVGTATDDETGVSGIYGAGARFKLRDDVPVTFRVDLDVTDAGNTDDWNYMLTGGLQYQF